MSNIVKAAWHSITDCSPGVSHSAEAPSPEAKQLLVIRTDQPVKGVRDSRHKQIEQHLIHIYTTHTHGNERIRNAETVQFRTLTKLSRS